MPLGIGRNRRIDAAHVEETLVTGPARYTSSFIALTGAATLAASPLAALGQDTDRAARPPTTELEELIVSATRGTQSDKSIPNKVTFVYSEDIQVQQTLTTNPVDLLSNTIPGFSPSRQKLVGLGETFRGRAPLYLVDGVPQSNPMNAGSRAGFTIDLGVVESIEVVYGANAIQGMGAAGGIINYITARAPAHDGVEQYVEAGMTIDDSFNGDAFGWRTLYRVGVRSGQWDFVGSAGYEERGLSFDGDSNPVGIDETQGDVADSDSYNLFVKLGYEPSSNQRIQLMANRFELAMQDNFVAADGDRSLGIPTTTVRGTTPGVPAENDVTTASLTYANTALLGGRFTGQTFYQDFSSNFGGGTFGVFQDPQIAPEGELFDQSQDNSTKHGLRLTQRYGEIGGLPLQLMFGFDYLQDEFSQSLIFTGRNWVPESKFKNHAWFLQLDYDPIDWLTLTGGLRWEFAKVDVPDYVTLAGNRPDRQRVSVEGGKPDFDETLFNVGAVIRPTDNVNLYATLSEGFIMPDVGRVLRAVSQFDTAVETFLDLQPIVTDNLEFGIEVEYGRGAFQLAWYESNSDYGSLLILNEEGTFVVNRQETEVTGWDVSGTFEANSWLTLGASYAQLRGKFDANGDGNLDTDLGAINIGPDRFNLSLEINPPGIWSGRLQSFTFFDRKFRNAAGVETARFDGYTVVDGYIAADLRRTRISLGIANLLDKQYITYYGQAGAGNRNDRYFAGRGRTLMVRGDYRF